jgi:hypothetical protein
MARFIVKLNDGHRDFYLEWSSVVDAPVTYGMSLAEFRAYYREEYGNSSMDELERRLDRVNLRGTSCFTADSAKDLISFNRAGKGETCLTLEQVIDAYCVNTGWAMVEKPVCPIEGTRHQE